MFSLRSRRRYRPRLEACEARIAPATATLSSGVLTIDYTAAGFTAEAVTLTNNGTNITLTGNIAGATTNPVASVNRIVLQDSGGGTAQSATLTGTSAFSLSGGLSCSDIETATFKQAI